MEQMTIFDYESKKEIPLMKWIPCKDRLPDTQDWYIVTAWSTETRKNEVTMEHWVIRDGQGKWHFSAMEHVFAWMPMPEIYEEDDSCHQKTTSEH